MNIETISRLSLAKHLHDLGISNLRSTNDLHLFAAVNLLQDAVEAFLLALADHVGAAVDKDTKFDKYFALIDAKIAPKTLPFRSKLLRLNLLRVNSKHHGIQPARAVCERYAESVQEFFDEASSMVLGVDFATVSALDLLEEGDAKQCMVSAKEALEQSDWPTCLIECRKAIFVEIEGRYDISEYADETPSLLKGWGCDAPPYARSKRYIEESVHDPSEFIVRDHEKLNQELLAKHVDPTTFWNVWRLTPEVYRTKSKVWIVKHDFDILEHDVAADTAAYVFRATIDIVLAIHNSRRAVRTKKTTGAFIELLNDEVPVFEKADRSSKIKALTPVGMRQINTDFRIPGLTDEGPYWHVMHANTESSLFLWGYIHNEHVKG